MVYYKRHIGTVIFLVLLVAVAVAPMGGLRVSIAQENITATPSPTITTAGAIPSNLPVITRANATRLTKLATLSPGKVYGATWSSDGKMLAVYGMENIWLYTLNDLTSRRFPQPKIGFSNLVFSPDGKHFATEDFSNSSTYSTSPSGVGLWDISSGTEDEFLSNVGSPSFNADGTTLIVRDLDKGASRLLFWDLSERKYRAALPDVYLAVPNPNGTVVACAENKQNRSLISLRDAKSGQLIRVLDSWKERIGAMAFDPSGKWFGAVSASEGVKVWKAATGQLQRKVGLWLSGLLSVEEGVDFSIFFSGDGTLVVLVATPVGRQAGAGIWEVRTGIQIDKFLTDYASAIYFTDKTMIAIDDYRSEYTLFRGQNVEGKLDGAFPKFNPSRTLIALYDYRQGIVLYGVR
jgi:hypothetical protein